MICLSGVVLAGSNNLWCADFNRGIAGCGRELFCLHPDILDHKKTENSDALPLYPFAGSSLIRFNGSRINGLSPVGHSDKMGSSMP